MPRFDGFFLHSILLPNILESGHANVWIGQEESTFEKKNTHYFLHQQESKLLIFIHARASLHHLVM